MDKQIHSRKELLQVIPEQVKTKRNLKLFRKMFSVAAHNRWNVFVELNRLRVEFSNNFIEAITYIPLDKISSPKITFNEVTFKKSQKTFRVSKSRYFQALLLDTGELIQNIRFNSSLKSFTFLRYDNVIAIGELHKLETDIFYANKNCFKDLPYNFFISAENSSTKLCIQSTGPFKKGMIVDGFNIKYNYQNRNPLDLVNSGVNAGLHRINFSLACDLNLVTLEQLENIGTQTFSCSKQKFGCQRGCTHYCYADNANKADERIRKTLIELWKECFEEKEVKSKKIKTIV